jgi:transposase InsO family protein
MSRKRTTRRESRSKEPTATKRPRGRPGRAGYPLDVRVRVCEQVVDHGVAATRVAAAFGIPITTVYQWTRLYRVLGADAYRAGRGVPSIDLTDRGGRAADVRRDAVVDTRTANPTWGTRRIRDVLERFEGLGVPETEVRRILHEAGLIEEAPPPRTPHEHGPRRFERAEPNQLWQSDIFTFLLRRHERLYVAAFMDDHSRYLVSWSLAHHQKSDLVMEALRRGIAAYGAPREILTDQGRQYTAWRGETDFEQELRREGIRHIKSRPQHPQTLGKIERFWKTLWDEFLSKTVFADFADCERRIQLFVDAYNFQRPHQALSGLVPADRFFRAAAHVRAAIEATVAENAMRLAHERTPRKPFYLVGRLGDRDLTIAASGNGLRVKVGDEAAQTIELQHKEGDDGRETNSRYGSGTKAEEDETRYAQASDSAVAQGAERPRRDGAASMSDAPARAERRPIGDGRGGRGEDFAPALLPVRDPRSARDARGVDAGVERGGLAGGVADRTDRSTRDEGESAREGQATRRATALRDQATASVGASDDGPWATAEAPSLDDEWDEAFARLTHDVGDEEEVGAKLPERFDPDAGFRGRAMKWDRKLATADELAEGRADDEETAAGDVDVYAGSERAGGARGAIRGSERSDVGRDSRERGRASTADVAQSFSDADAPRAERSARSDYAGSAGSPAPVGTRNGARDDGESPRTRERTSGARALDLGQDAWRSVGPLAPASDSTGDDEAEQDAVDIELDVDADEESGPTEGGA